MGGFDIYVNASSAYIVPTGAVLGSLIVNPFATVICINDAAQPGSGACSVKTTNGPGVVEVSTIDSSGINECSGMATCSGMASTITYEAVAPIASTSISYPTGPGCSTRSVATPPNVCVLVSDATGTLERLRCVLQLLGKLVSPRCQKAGKVPSRIAINPITMITNHIGLKNRASLSSGPTCLLSSAKRRKLAITKANPRNVTPKLVNLLGQPVRIFKRRQ
jgi:hypothetical protein